MDEIDAKLNVAWNKLDPKEQRRCVAFLSTCFREPPALPLSPSCPPRPHCRYIDMVTRDKDDPRNKEEGEMGPGGVRMVVMADMRNDAAMVRFWAEMHARGSRMYEELSKMKVRGAADHPGALNGVLGTWDITSQG